MWAAWVVAMRLMGDCYVVPFLCWQRAEDYVLGLSLLWVRYTGVDHCVCKSIQELEEVPGEPVGVELISGGIQGSDVVHIVLDVCNTGLICPCALIKWVVGAQGICLVVV